MKAVVLAYHNVGCEGLSALLRNGFEIEAVFTHKDDPKENIWFDSVAELAARHGIPVYAPEDINHPLWIERIREMAPDVLFSFYYRHLVCTEILEIAPAGSMNLHGSMLPKYRGRVPVNWVLVNGEKETGVTLHHMVAKPDAGDIVAQHAIGIDNDDTAPTLYTKLIAASRELLDEALPAIRDGKATRTPQDHAAATYFGGRRPKDGAIDWQQSANEVRNLVRAVTTPYPGAFTYAGNRKCTVWSARVIPATVGKGEAAVPWGDSFEATVPGRDSSEATVPGRVRSVVPFVVECGEGALEITSGEVQDSLCISGPQLAQELGVAPLSQLGSAGGGRVGARRKESVLILGINGFIGSALSERILETGRYEVHGMDLRSNYIEHLKGREGFTFTEGDISIHREWIEYHVRKCDIVLPLVAIATPIEYTRNPLRVFELDFEENLRVIRYCVQYGKRLIFPSTSEVYGMCQDDEFDEDKSVLIQGPIRKQRWIYSCSKQLLDRVIWAYGVKEALKFTLFRPFNWMGPRLDTLDSARIGSSRVITQFILNLVEGTPILLVDGGEQRRCFTDVSDGVECLYRIIENDGGRCDSQIVNIGNPDNEASIRELAEMLVTQFEEHPLRDHFPPFVGMREVESRAYYGKGYQDVRHRRPSIKNAKKLVGWAPVIEQEESVRKTLDYFLRQAVEEGDF